MRWGLGLALLVRAAFPVANYLNASTVHHTDSYSYARNPRSRRRRRDLGFLAPPTGLSAVPDRGRAPQTRGGALRLLGGSAASWALPLISLDLITVVYGNLMVSECLFTTLLTAAALCVLTGQTPKATFGAAALLAAACYVRPVGLVLAILWPLLLWLVFGHRRKAVVFFSVVWLLLLPWFVRQKVKFGTFMFSRITRENPLFYNAAYVLAEIEGKPVGAVQ